MPHRKAKDLKSELLKVSRQHLLDEGYRNFSLRKVARKAGVTATSIYLYFDNKDHLIHLLMEEAIDQLNDSLEEAVMECADAIEKLKVLAYKYVEFALAHPREYQIIHMISSDEMSRYPKDKFRKARRGYEIVTRVLQEGTERGSLTEERPRLAAYTFWAQLHGVMSVVLSKRLDTRIDQTEFIEQAVEHIIKGFQLRTAVTHQTTGNSI